MNNEKCSNIQTIRGGILMVDVNNYKTIKEVAELYKPLFNESSIRQMLHKNTDGISNCVHKVGGKVFINLSKFENWFISRGKV